MKALRRVSCVDEAFLENRINLYLLDVYRHSSTDRKLTCVCRSSKTQVLGLP